MSMIASAKLGARLLRVLACSSSSGSCSSCGGFSGGKVLMGLLFLLSGGMLFRFFGKSLLFEGARCTGTGFQRHGSETSGEFVILLRYDMA